MADWQWFVTLTYRDPDGYSPSWTRPGWTYAKRSWAELCERVRPAVGELQWVRCFELQRDRGVPHIHALVGGLDATRYSEVATWFWERYGYNRFLAYNPELGAGYYLSKYVTKELGDIAFSPGLVPRQNGRSGPRPHS